MEVEERKRYSYNVFRSVTLCDLEHLVVDTVMRHISDYQRAPRVMYGCANEKASEVAIQHNRPFPFNPNPNPNPSRWSSINSLLDTLKDRRAQ